MNAFVDGTATVLDDPESPSELVHLRAVPSNPHSWVFASLLVTIHGVVALAQTVPGEVLLLAKDVVRIRRRRLVRLTVGGILTVLALVRLVVGDGGGCLGVLVAAALIDVVVYLNGIRAVIDSDRKSVTIKHLSIEAPVRDRNA